MPGKKVNTILQGAKESGWVMEPQAKELLASQGFDVPKFAVAKTVSEVRHLIGRFTFPVVAKVVSPAIIHKTEVRGVVTGIRSVELLEETFERFSTVDRFAGMLIEETVRGVELIVGAKIDYQFGPMILLGIGGTMAELYGDVSLRMAPLTPADVEDMVHCLKARRILEGYRGAQAVDMEKLTKMLLLFSGLVIKIEPLIESIDLNPVMCSRERCAVADARIMLAK